MPDEGDIMAGIATDATGIATGISSLQSGLETPDVALNLRKQGDSVVSGVRMHWAKLAGSYKPRLAECLLHMSATVTLLGSSPSHSFT
jgi:hypothetical protein